MHMLGMYVTARTVYLAAATIVAGGLALTVFLLLILHDSGQRAAPRTRRQARPRWQGEQERWRASMDAARDSVERRAEAARQAVAAPAEAACGLWQIMATYERPPTPKRWHGPRAVPDVDRLNDQVRRRYRAGEAEAAAAIRQAGGLQWP